MLFNTERKTETLRVLVLHLLLTLSCRGQSQLIGSSQPIVAALGDDIILPCLLVPAEDASDLTLEWARPDLNPRFVHLWRSGVELLTKKHQSFKGRTSLFIDELKVGNISLKLSNVTVADRGTYKCFLPGLDRQTLVQLVVGAASPPVLTLSGIDGDKGGVVLDCESRGWYPEPEVLWLDAEGNLLSAGPTETVRGPDDLYTVSSRVTVERHSNSFTCRVHQKSTTQTRDAHITVPEDFFKAPPSSVPIITGLAVSLTGCFLLVLLLLFVVWRWRPTRTKNKAEDEPVTEGREREREREREQLMKKKEEETRREEARREEAEKEVQALKEELETKKKELETKQTEMQNLEEEKKKNETEMQKMKEELENKNKELVTARQKQGRSFFSFMGRSEEEQQQEVKTLKEKMETQQKEEMEMLKEEMETQQKESNMKIKKLEDQQQTVNAQWVKTNEELKETKLQLENKKKELVTAPEKQGRRFLSLRGRSEREQEQEVETLKEKMETQQKEKMETQQKEKMETQQKEKMETLKEEMETLKEEMETQQKESNMKIKKLEDQQQTVNTQWMKTNEELKETKLQLEIKREENSQLKRELHKLLFDEQKKKEEADEDMKEQLFIEQKKKEEADKDMKELVEENMERDKKLNEETRRRKQAEREVETLKEELSTKYQNQNPEETTTREKADKQVQTSQEDLVSSQRPHQEDSSSANHNSTPGSVFVIDVDQQGKYIRVRNTSYQEQHLGGWRFEMMINRKPICYSFNESLKVKSGHPVSMRGPGCGILSPSDLWWKEFRPINSADKLKFTLINISTCERHELSSSLVNN